MNEVRTYKAGAASDQDAKRQIRGSTFEVEEFPDRTLFFEFVITFVTLAQFLRKRGIFIQIKAFQYSRRYFLISESTFWTSHYPINPGFKDMPVARHPSVLSTRNAQEVEG